MTKMLFSLLKMCIISTIFTLSWHHYYCSGFLFKDRCNLQCNLSSFSPIGQNKCNMDAEGCCLGQCRNLPASRICAEGSWDLQDPQVEGNPLPVETIHNTVTLTLSTPTLLIKSHFKKYLKPKKNNCCNFLECHITWLKLTVCLSIIWVYQTTTKKAI